jgi:glycosyltransferase involved in cell wall biosynthesis
VHRVNVSAPEDHTAADVRLRLARVAHYVRARPRVRSALASAPAAPILWTSISPAPLGHARDLLTVAPAFQPNQPVYAVVHRGDFHHAFEHPLTARTMRKLVDRLRGVVFLNQTLADRCAPWIPAEKRLIVPNTIEESLLCSRDDVEEKQERRRQRSAFRLLFLSNMIPTKGYLDALHAVRLLHKRGLPVHADFVGRWVLESDREAFHQRVQHAGLEAVVTHHGGIQNRARIRAFYLGADAFLLPTYYPTEAQPLTIIEALNAGTPVITTRHAGIPDMVRDGQEALLVPPRSPEAIADAAEQLASPEQWLALSSGARTRFERAFSPAAVRQQWNALLDACSTCRSASPH